MNKQSLRYEKIANPVLPDSLTSIILRSLILELGNMILDKKLPHFFFVRLSLFLKFLRNNKPDHKYE